MRVDRWVLSLLVPFGLVLASEAGARGACIFLEKDSLQCVDRVASVAACTQKSSTGQANFHDGTSCKKIGHGKSWGMLPPPPPPAKPAFHGVSHSMKAPGRVPPIPAPGRVPPIPSPFENREEGKYRF